MKKKLLTIIPVFLLTLTGCSTDNAPKEHTHNYDLDNVEWFWQETASGYKANAIFYCSTCTEDQEGHEISVDAKVTSELIKNPTCEEDGTLRFTAKSTFQDQEFSSYRDKNVHDENAHHYVEVVDAKYLVKEATCLENAIYYLSCEYCGKTSQNTFEAQGSKLPHQLTNHPSHESTCSEKGNIEYWTCNVCGHYFDDASGNHEINEQDIILPLTNNHSLIHYDAKTSTCSEQGNIEYWECQLCHRYFSDNGGVNEISAQDVLLPLAHDMTYHPGVEATCYNAGRHGYYTCSYEPGVLYQDEAGTIKFNSEEELIIPQLEHEFNESMECIHCQETLSDIYELQDASYLDKVSPISITSIGFDKEVNITPDSGSSSVEYFKNYEFSRYKALDLWMEYNYELQHTDSYFMIYLFNQVDESAAVFRLQTSRSEDDGIIPCYIYTHNQYGPATTFPYKPEGNMQYFPRISGVKSTTTNVIHITANCINEENNTFEICYMIGVKGQQLYYPSTNAEDKTNTKKTFIIELGANYFDDNKHNSIRFYGVNSVNVTLKELSDQSNEPLVTYMNNNGDVVGKTNKSTLSLPKLKVENKTLVGWFDLNGKRVREGQEVNSKLVIRPVFADTQEHMFSLDDFGTEDATYEPSCGEHYFDGISLENGNEYHVYLTYQLNDILDVDNYFIFGLPYDTLDEANRVMIRLNNSLTDTRMSGYVYGASLGAAGAEGTRFDSSHNFRPSPYETLLLHFSVHDNGNNSAVVSAEFINLVNNQSYMVTKDVTFSGFRAEPFNYGMTSEFLNRNRFAVQNAVNCRASIANVF